MCVSMTEQYRDNDVGRIFVSGLQRAVSGGVFLHLRVCRCVRVCLFVSQSLTPPWQACGPSPPPASPSAACPWP